MHEISVDTPEISGAKCFPMRKTGKPKKADWHSADIVAALKKAGWSLRRLSVHHGYQSPSTLKHALCRTWPKGQKIIAAAIGKAPETIWPSRYKGNTGKCETAPRVGKTTARCRRAAPAPEKGRNHE